MIRKVSLLKRISDRLFRRAFGLSANQYDFAQRFILNEMAQSKSQLGQDLFVLNALGRAKNGFFVEFGAADGVTNSNTYLLEKEYGWKGILVEPSKVWHQKLEKSRNCVICHGCVSSESGNSISFANFSDPEFSRMAKLPWNIGSPHHPIGVEIVTTISLEDLLVHYNAPKTIEYLSIDTEGNELDIIRSFDFSSFNIKCITVEHNYRDDDRREIFERLTAYGYERVFEDISKWDDWYILSD